MTDNKKNNRKDRGEVSENELNGFIKFSDNELIKLLKSQKATERTCAAKILGKRKSKKAIDVLCQALKTEKSLYSRIAISEALGDIGLPALPELIKLLGKIGKNQHKTLPDKPYEKKSYPLPRDIVARTITKIGKDAIGLLIKSIPGLQQESLSEAIDAIGFISYYTEQNNAFDTLTHQFELHRNNDLIIWKLIRALQAFPNKESIELLEYYLMNHPQKAIKCEAARSLGQICRLVPQSLANMTFNKNKMLSEMALLSVNKINKKPKTSTKKELNTEHTIETEYGL